MSRIITQCPSCESVRLNVVKIECEDCNTRFEGHFEISGLLKLPEDDLQFILEFVRCSGSLKEMAMKRKISYPTLRNHLNQLISKLEHITLQQESSKEEILSLLEKGKISAKEAAVMLKHI